MNLQKMMKQAQEMQSRMSEMQSRLEASTFDGSSGGGAVSMTITGKNDMLRVSIDPSLLTPADKETLEDLIIAAYRNAREKVDGTYTEEMDKLSKSISLPPGMKLPF
ncbi:MAG: YbaB/EbfC family nucleoid-associated protein [Rickettsiales bacterium]|jgi:DNA-binding YbaB/EbfC family protein|nr:YbaB/EbfC family nucleoid-associated protein [Rickettsiales bacterium]